MERWSSGKLDDVRSYLESKHPGTWSREDNYLAAEFVIQRYLPADEKRTQQQYEASMRDLKAKIDRNINNPDAPKEEVKDDPEFAEWLKDALK